MKTPEIITRLNAAASIMREHAQYSDDEFEHNGEGLAAVACDDAAAIILQLLAALGMIAEQARQTAGTFPNAPGVGDWQAVERIARRTAAELDEAAKREGAE